MNMKQRAPLTLNENKHMGFTLRVAERAILDVLGENQFLYAFESRWMQATLQSLHSIQRRMEGDMMREFPASFELAELWYNGNCTREVIKAVDAIADELQVDGSVIRDAARASREQFEDLTVNYGVAIDVD